MMSLHQVEDRYVSLSNRGRVGVGTTEGDPSGSRGLDRAGLPSTSPCWEQSLEADNEANA